MKHVEGTRNLLVKHYQKYPGLQIQDIFKFIHQSASGCEHMVSSLDTAIEYIRKESETGIGTENLIETLDGAYSRIHLSCMSHGLSAETLGKLFFASAKKEQNGTSRIEEKLAIARELVRENELPFYEDDFEIAVREWKEKGYPAIHHSDAFRAAYHPKYRVISNEYVKFLPLFSKIDELLKKGSGIVAIEGGSGSGKTTLSAMLQELYDCTVFHMDDFFLRPEQRTSERYAEVGGNIDRERFLKEVLVPLKKNEPIKYRRFDCDTFELCPPVNVVPKKLTIVEGAYCMHPELAGYYDLSVFLDISPEVQKARITKRNTPQLAERFFNEWIPLEKIYFSKMQVKDRCDISVLEG